MKNQILERARELGFDACRFTSAAPPDHSGAFSEWVKEGRHGQMEYLVRNAEKRVDPQKVLPGAKSIIILATSYHPAKPSEITSNSQSSAFGLSGGDDVPQTPDSLKAELWREEVGAVGREEVGAVGRIARYAQYSDYHDVLAAKLKELTQFLDALAGPGNRSLWYVDTGPLLERDLAQRAGLGFIGKHTNLISRNLGNWFFISEIISTVELAPDSPEHNRCGSCTRCISACPTGAITGPFQLDARRCISYLTIELKGSIPVEFRQAIGDHVYGCDDCLAACPWNRFAHEGSLMRAHRRSDLEAADLLELLKLDDARFKSRFAGSPILRTKRRGLLRNVCVVLGNIGDSRVLPALERALHDPEPLIAEHAQWAIGEIKSREIAQPSTGF